MSDYREMKIFKIVALSIHDLNIYVDGELGFGFGLGVYDER